MKPLQCILKSGKEKPLLARHPWVFSGAIDRLDEGYKAGDIVKVFSSQNQFLGMGYLNPTSQIAIRILSYEDVSINEGFFEKKIREAVCLRKEWFRDETTAYRMIHSEGDFLPGLVVDRYADFLTVQFLTAGMDCWRDVVVDVLGRELPVKGIFERDDGEWRDWEGLEKRTGVLAGSEPPEEVEVRENGILFLVDVRKGQKTGFYCDQRENRELVRKISSGRSVLNCFAYTGAFSIYAAKGGATKIVSVETSQSALDGAKAHCEKNDLNPEDYSWEKEDVAPYLRASREDYDLIILDPPAFCRNKQQVDKASRGYKDINLHALRRMKPGGLLFTFSCSSYMTPDLFQKVLFGAAKDAKRNVRVLAKTSHPVDHPINICHPEGEYLKGLLCQVG